MQCFCLSSEFLIRPLRPDDAHDLVALIHNLAHEEGKRPDEVLVTATAIHQFAFGPAPCFHCELAWYGEDPIGYALYTIRFSAHKGAPVLFLEDLYLKLEYRGLGCGAKLMRRLDEIAKVRDCAFLEWQVFDWDLSARGFYDAMGATRRDDLLTYRTSTGSLQLQGNS